MSRRGRLMPAVALVTACMFVAGCFTPLPEQFATPEEAFPSSQFDKGLPTDVPAESKKVVRFDATYEDVWRATTVSVSQAQLNVETAQKAKGLIHATRIVKGKRRQFPNAKTTMTYLFLVKEEGAKSVSVHAVAKSQTECKKWTPLTWVVLPVITFGIALLDAGHQLECVDIAEAQYAKGEFSSEEELAQVITFTRNNLIAAGAM